MTGRSLTFSWEMALKADYLFFLLVCNSPLVFGLASTFHANGKCAGKLLERSLNSTGVCESGVAGAERLTPFHASYPIKPRRGCCILHTDSSENCRNIGFCKNFWKPLVLVVSHYLGLDGNPNTFGLRWGPNSS